MDKYAHIASLIRKLLNDDLSPEELNELQYLFRSAEAEGDVEGWLTHVWESSGQQDIYSIDSASMRDKLMQKAGMAQQVRPPMRSMEDPMLVRFVRSLMRYAAVFLLAMVFSWYQFGRDKQPAPPTAGTTVSVGGSEVSVTYGSKTRIVLPDSSMVYLNSGSRLSYSPVFDSERHVTLTGEGYFIVRSDSLHPFVVHTADVSVKALGTEFNVKAYPEEGSVETVLVSGMVEILKRGHTNAFIELKPGEKAAYVKALEPEQSTDVCAPSTNAVKEQPQMIVDVDMKPDVSTGWVKNQLVFDAEPFEQIAIRLERWFNVEIDIIDETLKKTRLTGRYDTENIEQVIHSLQIAIPFVYNIEKNKIVIR